MSVFRVGVVFSNINRRFDTCMWITSCSDWISALWQRTAWEGKKCHIQLPISSKPVQISNCRVFFDISKINRFYWLLKKNWLEVPFKTTQEIMIHSSNMYLVHVGEIQITNYHSYMLERYKLPITITSYNWLQGVVYNPHISFQNISYSVN